VFSVTALRAQPAPTPPVATIPDCHVVHYYNFQTGVSHSCYCNYGLQCNPVPPYSHCDPPWDFLCAQPAPPTTPPPADTALLEIFSALPDAK
jgi:hypothetical protein